MIANDDGGTFFFSTRSSSWKKRQVLSLWPSSMTESTGPTLKEEPSAQLIRTPANIKRFS